MLVGLATHTLSLEFPPEVYHPLRKLGQACCSPDPQARPSAARVVHALKRLVCHVAANPRPGHGDGL